MDFTTTYLGMNLKNPIVPSASPLSNSLDSIRRLEDAGAAAVVMYSLFEEQISLESEQLDYYLAHSAESHAEALSYFPEMSHYNVGPEEYLELIRQAKQAVDIPVIGSLNGVSRGGWMEYARCIEEAGADALELNLYYIATNPEITSLTTEYMYLDAVAQVKESVNIPVAVKIGPFFSAMANVAHGLYQSGADALVMFNRFYQPDLDIESLEVTPSLTFSRSEEMRLPLRWVAILYGRVPVDFAITGGVHTYKDVLKAMMAGANIAMMAAELLQNGLGRIGEILAEITRWMEELEYQSIRQMRGALSQRHVAEPAAFERANYMKVLQSFRPERAGKV
jgi:dihydroorotate dehydrogenase (fumarate)